MSDTTSNVAMFGPMVAGDSDMFYVDISAWSKSRNGEVPASAITVTIEGTGLTAGTPSYVAGAPFAVGAIQCRLSGGLSGHTYSIEFSFTSNLGNTISRFALLTVQRYIS